jgi:uncharacterized protein
VRIVVDADSMAPRVRAIIVRAASRHGLEAVFVANRRLPVPESDDGVTMIVAEDADDWIAGSARSDDLVITRDVPLAARVVELGAEVISDRGEHYTRENIGTRLSERDFAMRLRSSGEIGPAGGARRPRDAAREGAAFANELDRWLVARSRTANGPGGG